VVYVTHDMTEVLHCHRLVVLAGGEIVFCGKPLDFFADPELLNIAGLQAPPIIELVNGLVAGGLELPGNICSPEELVEAICQ
ncbi:MAG: energy-coupling factor transporter ATPase, partial [Eubacteriales bacterium]